MPGDFELIYVDDGSGDSSLQILLRLQKETPGMTVVELSRNWGHQAALTSGLRTARGDAVILMDGDFQDPPESLPQLVDAWKAGGQVVVAERTARAEIGLRKILIPIFYRLLRYLSDFPIPLNAGIFGLVDRQVVDAGNAEDVAYPFGPERLHHPLAARPGHSMALKPRSIATSTSDGPASDRHSARTSRSSPGFSTRSARTPSAFARPA